MRHASLACGCNVDTLIKHYVAMDEQAATADVFEKMADEEVERPPEGG